jgi:hypothetical protein
VIQLPTIATIEHASSARRDVVRVLRSRTTTRTGAATEIVLNSHHKAEEIEWRATLAGEATVQDSKLVIIPTRREH